jgi:hypothetical protein
MKGYTAVQNRLKRAIVGGQFTLTATGRRCRGKGCEMPPSDLRMAKSEAPAKEYAPRKNFSFARPALRSTLSGPDKSARQQASLWATRLSRDHAVGRSLATDDRPSLDLARDPEPFRQAQGPEPVEGLVERASWQPTFPTHFSLNR